jgi:4-hydroxybenzoate polyprenyltransferase
LPTVWTNVSAGIALAGGDFGPASAASLGASASAAYVGGMFLNDAFDRAIDAGERPDRPIPSGAISAGEVFTVGFVLLAIAVAGFGLVANAVAPENLRETVLAASTLAVLVVFYDAWHKQNPASSAIMGLCRGAVYVTSGLASGGAFTWPLVTGALALVAFVFGLTAIARQENRRRFRGVAPLALLAAPVAVAGGAASMDAGAWVALALFATWVTMAVAPLFRRGDVNVPRAVVRLIAGISLLDGMVGAAHGSAAFALGGVAGLVATLALQRWVRGT